MSAERKPIGINHLTVKPRNFDSDATEEADKKDDLENNEDTENIEK